MVLGTAKSEDEAAEGNNPEGARKININGEREETKWEKKKEKERRKEKKRKGKERKETEKNKGVKQHRRMRRRPSDRLLRQRGSFFLESSLRRQAAARDS